MRNDSDNDFKDLSSDEGENLILYSKKTGFRGDVFEENADEDSDKDKGLGKICSSEKSTKEPQTTSVGVEVDGDEVQKDDLNQDRNLEANDLKKLKKQKIDRIKQLKAFKKSKYKTGVVYLSKIPPYMKPSKLRHVMGRFGEIDRLFLKREEEHVYKKRIKSGGNKKAMFKEGWVEFIRKKDAKICASTLNANILGGKKGNFYHDDVINIKYLSGFKWADLTEQISRENDIRQAKLQLEISQANKLNADFVRNVEKSKMLENMKANKRSTTEDSGEIEVRRTFKQRFVTSNRARASEGQKDQSSSKLESVLHNLL